MWETPVFPSITAWKLAGHVYFEGITSAWVIARDVLGFMADERGEQLIISLQMKGKHALPALQAVKEGL